MIPQSFETSLECWSKFWPYDDLYFILPTTLINSGCKPWIPKSITVLLPISIISWSICFSVFFTISSILAGCILPSVTNLWRDNLAISLLIESKQDNIIASGVSSTIISTPVAASKALIFLPSLPIILPLTSSDSMLKTETQLSIDSSVPILWIVLIIIFLASCSTVIFASSILFWINFIASDFASSLIEFISWSLASCLDKPEMTSNCLIWLSLSLSNSIRFLSRLFIFLSKSFDFNSKSEFKSDWIFKSLEALDSLSVTERSNDLILSSLA